MWYLNDATIDGQISSVFNDAIKIIDAFKEIGLQLNPNKCELLILNHPAAIYADTVKLFSFILSSVLLPPHHSWSVLGSSLTHEAIVFMLDLKLGDIPRLCSKLKEVEPFHAFILLKNCFSIPKLVHIFRTCLLLLSPTFYLILTLSFVLFFRQFPMFLCLIRVGSKYLFLTALVV